MILRPRTVSAHAIACCAATLIACALVPAPVAAQESTGRRPAPLPGSAPLCEGEDRYLLAHDGFEDALSHFGDLLGEPMTTGENRETGTRSAFFVYRTESQPNDVTLYTGVRVIVGNSRNGVSLALEELRTAVQRGHLTQARYEQIETEYAELSTLFFRAHDDPDRPVDEEIVERYRRFLRRGIWLELEDLQREIDRAMKNRDPEALERLQEMIAPDVERHQRLLTTDEIVDHWLECLEEIRAAAESDAYPLYVDMEYTLLVSDNRKG